MARKKDQRAAEARRCSEGLRHLLVSYKLMFEDSLRKQGLTLAQVRLLKAIEERSDVSAAELARRCMVTPQTLQAVLARAEREGWIVRGSSERNRRFVTASLTDSGAAVLELGSRMAAEIEERIWRGVKLRELVILNEVVGKGIANLEEEARDLEKMGG